MVRWLLLAYLLAGGPEEGLGEDPLPAAPAAPALDGRPDPANLADVLADLPAGLEHEALEGQLLHMRELVLRLREARPDLFVSGSLDRARPYVPARDDLDRASGYLGKELALLEQTVLLLTEGEAGRDPGWLRSHERELHGTRQVYTVDVAASDAFANHALELVNVGTRPVRSPRVALVGDVSDADLETLAAELEARAETPRELARSVFAWVVEHRYHAEPAHTGLESHDPIKLRHVWGYGFCDDSANAFVTLARAVGLEARVWGLGGHIVPEVFYDGGWHLYDVGHETWYLDVTGRHVASLAELEADVDLLDFPRRLPGRDPWPFELARTKAMVASVEDNVLAGYEPVTSEHSMDFVLRQGEGLRWSWGHEGARYSDGYYGVPQEFGNGRWFWDRPSRADDRLPLRLPFELPYPVLDGQVVVSPSRDAPSSGWRLLVRRGEGPWWPADEPARDDGVLRFALGGVLGNGSGEPDYALEFALHADAGTPPPEAVHVQLVFQHAPAALPALQPGRNELVFTSETPEARLRVVHRVQE